MSLLDFQHPDIAWGRSTVLIDQFRDANDTIVILSHANRLAAIRVHAIRGDHSRVMSRTYFSWDCSNLRTGVICGYHPGPEDMPPLPGQRCHNCGNTRADAISLVTTVRPI
jgi:hypothetical protein